MASSMGFFPHNPPLVAFPVGLLQELIDFEADSILLYPDP